MSDGFCWIGVDLGVHGAIAVIDRDGMAEVHDLPYHSTFGKNRYVDAYLIWKMAHGEDPVLPADTEVAQVLIEQPGEYTPNSATAMQLGHCFGVMNAVFAPYWHDVVRAKEWQRHYLEGSGRSGWSKRFALELAREMFPELEDDLQRVTKDDGRAEALLIANYARETGGDDGD